MMVCNNYGFYYGSGFNKVYVTMGTSTFLECNPWICSSCWLTQRIPTTNDHAIHCAMVSHKYVW